MVSGLVWAMTVCRNGTDPRFAVKKLVADDQPGETDGEIKLRTCLSMHPSLRRRELGGDPKKVLPQMGP